MPRINIQQASRLYKVTERTIYNWIKEDGLQAKNSLYLIDDLQKSYDKRRKPKPRLHY